MCVRPHFCLLPIAYALRLLAVATAVPVLPAETSGGALSCQNIVLPMEDGATYRESVRNEDYRFAAVIPAGKTGWGVEAPAPFHGFTMFLDGDGRYRAGESCIDLYVGVRVSLPEDSSQESAGRRVRNRVDVGNRRGFEVVDKETVGGRPFLVVTVNVDLPRPSGSDYMSLTLISPANRYTANRKVFDKFLSDLTFW
jgi:hypothetical protein